MRVNGLPQAVLSRLFELDDRAARLAADADRAEADLKEALRILNDLRPRSMGGDRELNELRAKTRLGFDATREAALAVRSRATAAVAELNKLKTWIQGLPDGTALELAPAVMLNGQSLSAVRQRLQAIAAEIAALTAAPVGRADDRERIASLIDQLRREAAPAIVRDVEGRISEINWSPAVTGFGTGARAMAAWLHGDLLADRLMQQVAADCAKPLPVEQRAGRISELAQEREELWRIESALISADPRADGDSSIPPWVALGVRGGGCGCKRRKIGFVGGDSRHCVSSGLVHRWPQ